MFRTANFVMVLRSTQHILHIGLSSLRDLVCKSEGSRTAWQLGVTASVNFNAAQTRRLFFNAIAGIQVLYGLESIFTIPAELPTGWLHVCFRREITQLIWVQALCCAFLGALQVVSRLCTTFKAATQHNASFTKAAWLRYSCIGKFMSQNMLVISIKYFNEKGQTTPLTTIKLSNGDRKGLQG